jgi:hypothetical protein
VGSFAPASAEEIDQPNRTSLHMRASDSLQRSSCDRESSATSARTSLDVRTSNGLSHRRTSTSTTRRTSTSGHMSGRESTLTNEPSVEVLTGDDLRGTSVRTNRTSVDMRMSDEFSTRSVHYAVARTLDERRSGSNPLDERRSSTSPGEREWC